MCMERAQMGHCALYLFRWAAVGQRPLEHFEMASQGGVRTRPRVPGAAVGARPLENIEMTSMSCKSTRPCVPGTAISPRPLEHPELTSHGCTITHPFDHSSSWPGLTRIQVVHTKRQATRSRRSTWLRINPTSSGMRSSIIIIISFRCLRPSLSLVSFCFCT
jgi:hypothetical protein